MRDGDHLRWPNHSNGLRVQQAASNCRYRWRAGNHLWFAFGVYHRKYQRRQTRSFSIKQPIRGDMHVAILAQSRIKRHVYSGSAWSIYCGMSSFRFSTNCKPLTMRVRELLCRRGRRTNRFFKTIVNTELASK